TLLITKGGIEMREIKFRVWNLEKEKMYRVIKLSDSFYGDCEEPYCYYENEEGKAEFLPLSMGVILQCTGLKDKNDKEIYEGDIVEYQNITEQQGVILTHEQIGEVKIDK